MQRCSNCKRTIGNLETPYLFERHTICKECADRLGAAATQSIVEAEELPASDIVYMADQIPIARTIPTFSAGGVVGTAPMMGCDLSILRIHRELCAKGSRVAPNGRISVHARYSPRRHLFVDAERIRNLLPEVPTSAREGMMCDGGVNRPASASGRTLSRRPCRPCRKRLRE
jgi:hypothetical protein